MNDLELSDLWDMRRTLQRKIDNFFKGGDVYEGDHGYQQLLMEMDDLNDRIAEANTPEID